MDPNASVQARRHDFDQLRTLAMLTGVAFHAALSYSPMLHLMWPSADRQSSKWVDVSVWLLHFWRMPVFFVIAGFFAAQLVARRGLGGMLRNRASRVLCPLLLFWPIIQAATAYLTWRASTSVTHQSALLTWLHQHVTVEGAAWPLPGLGQFWFLYYLMIFYGMIWLNRALEWSAIVRRINDLKPSTWLMLMPAALIPAMYASGAPWPAPNSFLPQWWALLYFGFFFALGSHLFDRETMLSEITATLPLPALAALAGFGYVLFLGLFHIQYQPAPNPWLVLLQATLQAYISVWLTLGSLSFAQRCWHQENTIIRNCAQASYWVYLVHLPILFGIQFHLMDVELAWPWKFFIALFGTLALAFLSYHLLVRRTWIGRMLNG